MVGSYKPLHAILPKTIKNTHTDAGNPTEVSYVKDNPRSLTLLTQPKTTPSVEKKSSRVHVGRHEILVRSWPHPDPMQTLSAHQLLVHVQNEQHRMYGLKEQKQLLVITLTYVRTFQAVHLNGLVHTLRAVSGPLIWIVVEAGGVSKETAALLGSSQLSFYHLGFHEVINAESKHIDQLEARLRLEGLRFIGEQQLDGIVVFADESSTYSLDFFDEVQKVKWIGFCSVGLLSTLSRAGLSEESIEIVDHQSSEANMEQRLNGSNAAKSSSVEESIVPNLALPFQTPVCNSSGHIIGWYLPHHSVLTQGANRVDGLKWTGFALSARILWKEYKKPWWIKSWTELFGGDLSAFRTPLAFVVDASFVEPMGSCGQDVYLWWVRVEARGDSKFPSRWVIRPPLDVVVPSKRTPWPEAVVGSPPPPRQFPPSIAVINQHAKRRSKGAKGVKAKRGSHSAKQGREVLIS